MHASWYSDVDAVQSISEQNERLSKSFYGLNRRTDTISLWSIPIFLWCKDIKCSKWMRNKRSKWVSTKYGNLRKKIHANHKKEVKNARKKCFVGKSEKKGLCWKKKNFIEKNIENIKERRPKLDFHLCIKLVVVWWISS